MSRRERECDGKQAHPNRKAAEAARNRVIEQWGASRNRIRSYRCRWCRQWHVGHPGAGTNGRTGGRRRGRRS